MEPKDQARNYANTNKIWFFSLVFFVFSYLILTPVLQTLLLEEGAQWRQFLGHLIRLALFLPLFWGVLGRISWQPQPVFLILAIILGLLLAYGMSLITAPQPPFRSPLFFVNLAMGTLMEEWFFRGVFVFSLPGEKEGGQQTPRVQKLFWLMTSSLFFSLAHAQPWEAFFWVVLPFGVGLYLLTKKTGSLLPAVCFHLVYNLVLAFMVPSL
jgi:membrane protease YdiL (CAAX protease family)